MRVTVGNRRVGELIGQPWHYGGAMNDIPPPASSPAPAPGSATAASQQALDDLVALLDLEADRGQHLPGSSPDENRQRVFGGQVAGQALVAAARTIDEPARLVHSLHAYFLRPGDPTVPILYEVDRIRDGKSFTTRRVVAIQHGRAIFNLQASFHTHEPGPITRCRCPQDVAPPRGPPRLPDPHGAVRRAARRAGTTGHARSTCATSTATRSAGRARRPTSQQVWLRADGRLPDDPVLHACIVTYASDMTLLDTTVLPFGLSWDSPGHADGEPRPRDVVPPAVPRRRVAALRPGGDLDVVGPRLAGGSIYTAGRPAGRERRAGGSGTGRVSHEARLVQCAARVDRRRRSRWPPSAAPATANDDVGSAVTFGDRRTEPTASPTDAAGRHRLADDVNRPTRDRIPRRRPQRRRPPATAAVDHDRRRRRSSSPRSDSSRSARSTGPSTWRCGPATTAVRRRAGRHA